MSKNIEIMAAELQNLSDDFDGEDSPEEVIRAVLERDIQAIQEREQNIIEKQESLREKMFGASEDTGDDDEDLPDDPVARKRAELRKQMFEK
jgi:hypothetical protein